MGVKGLFNWLLTTCGQEYPIIQQVIPPPPPPPQTSSSSSQQRRHQHNNNSIDDDDDSGETVMSCDHLYIDLNHFIYQSVHHCVRIWNESYETSTSSTAAATAASSATGGDIVNDALCMDAIERELLRRIDTVIACAPPVKLLYLATDGVAPVAKWLSQRERRRRVHSSRNSTTADVTVDPSVHSNLVLLKLPSEWIALFGNTNSKSDGGRSGLERSLLQLGLFIDEKKSEQQQELQFFTQSFRSERDVVNCYFDLNCISPGTLFMSRVDRVVRDHMLRKLNAVEINAWKRVERIIISDSTCAGEGEHKIFDFIRSQDERCKTQLTHVVACMDSDVVFLSLLSRVSKISVLVPKDLDRSQSPVSGSFSLIKVFLIRNYLRDMMEPIEELAEDGDLDFDFCLTRVVEDFCFMSFLLGNDFLPSCSFLGSSASSLNKLLKQYMLCLEQMGGYITDGINIDMDRFGKFLASMRAQERQHFSSGIGKDDTAWIRQYYQLQKVDLSVLSSSEEMLAFRKDLAAQWLNGMIWCWRYYNEHGVPSWKWFLKRQNIIPLFADIDLLRGLAVKEIVRAAEQDFASSAEMPPPKPFTQLVNILPMISARCLPIQLKSLLEQSQFRKDDLIDDQIVMAKLDGVGRKQHRPLIRNQQGCDELFFSSSSNSALYARFHNVAYGEFAFVSAPHFRGHIAVDKHDRSTQIAHCRFSVVAPQPPPSLQQSKIAEDTKHQSGGQQMAATHPHSSHSRTSLSPRSQKITGKKRKPGARQPQNHSKRISKN